MRTTITLDPDVEALVRKAMKERKLSFKEAVNEALRAGLGSPTSAEGFRTPTFSMGRPIVDLDRALRLAGQLEDDELRDRLSAGS